MIKFLLILMLGCAIILSITAIFSSFRLHFIKKKAIPNYYHTPRLSELKGKEFSDYIDYLTRDL